MTYKQYQPIDPRDAFTIRPRRKSKSALAAAEDSESVAASQAAFLLAVRAGVLGHTPTTEKLREFPLPDLGKLRRMRRLRVDQACEYLGVSQRELRQEPEPDLRREMTRAARDVYEKPSLEAAAALFEAAMHSSHPLVAVAGAAGARETTRLRDEIRSTLDRAYRSKDVLTSRLALAAMGQIGPMDAITRKRVIKTPKSRKRRRKSNTAVVAHGTWAAGNDWYRPGGDFYEALKSKRPDLDIHDQSFRWSGGYSHEARQDGARLLRQWIPDQGLSVPDFFAHSHGATVAHMATKGANPVQFDRLVLMGWPARERFFPDFSRVKRIIDVRVRMDLVILLDGGAQRFRTSAFPVEKHRHGWFDHSSTHESAYWDKHGLWDVL